MTRFATVAFLLLAWLFPPQTGRDRPASLADATGTALVSGAIRDNAPQPQPVARAIVTLKSAELPRGRTVISDDQGRFVFDRLPAGRFTLEATKPAYLTAA